MNYFIKSGIFLVLLLNGLITNAQTENEKFNEIYHLTNQKNYFKAKEIYSQSKEVIPMEYQKFTEAILANAFNRLVESQKKVIFIVGKKQNIPDSLMVKLYEVSADNAVKMYEYKNAKNATETILNNYKEFLSSEKRADYENNLKMWSALEKVPPQKVVIKGYTGITMTKDVAGLNNLKVSVKHDTLNFIFDTGANISTTSQSVAKRLKMRIIPVDIEVGSITGKKVMAQLAVCDNLKLGHIDLHNVVFLVMPDEGLSFPQIKYQIYGILGYPVIEALKEIRIKKTGDFIVPKKRSTFTENSNLAMDGLTPLIYIDKMHFTFDTGADHTILYNLYYSENQNAIDIGYSPTKITFGGAGGTVERDGYIIDHTFNIIGKKITLKDIQLIKEKIKPEESVYGNIGQDIIQEFNTMILNFEQMFIKFE